LFNGRVPKHRPEEFAACTPHKVVAPDGDDDDRDDWRNR
jgi:hypothetical protein